MTRKNLLKGFKRPSSIVFEKTDLNPCYGKFIAYPFEPGFGTTIGNTLRRILLSSIQGYAITSVRIASYDADDVSHDISSEFEVIPNITEDTIEILNSLKQLRLRLTGDVDQDTFHFDFKGPATVTSDMFNHPGRLEILSKNVSLFTLNRVAHVEFEFEVELGRGYVPAEIHEQNINVVGTIPMDAIFTPVPKVKYTIEPCRLGQRSDYDKLILELWTDGTISPDDALAEAAKIAKEHFTQFISFDDNEMLDDSGGSVEISDVVRALLDTPVAELELSVRAANCLSRCKTETIGQLTRCSEDDLSNIPNFGRVSLDEIKRKLNEKGLWLGMNDYDYSHVKTKTKEVADES